MNANTPYFYTIRIQGQLGVHWSTWFDEMTITHSQGPDGQPETVLSGIVADQAALFGLLAKIHDLALPLIALHRSPLAAKP